LVLSHSCSVAVYLPGGIECTIIVYVAEPPGAMHAIIGAVNERVIINRPFRSAAAADAVLPHVWPSTTVAMTLSPAPAIETLPGTGRRRLQ